jgi:hypothetical protein
MNAAIRERAARPRVTLVMTVRERHGLTLESIANILANTTIPHRFIFAHGELPPWLDEGIQALARAGRIESRRFDGNLWPQHIRRAIAREIDTDYVAFIDNDILVSPGWMEKLIACADETGAGAVAPVYLWGNGKEPPKIHMAGGKLREQRIHGGGCVLEEQHAHMNEDPVQVLPKLARAPCDTVEFHCMVMPTALARDPATLDDSIACVHEHIDVCLTLRARGIARMLEPAAQVTYLAYAPMTLEDVPLLRWRWDRAAVEASIAAFSRKWGVVPDDRSFGGVRGYAEDMRARNDPLRAEATLRGVDLPMSGADLPQTRSQLLDLALARGLPEREVGFLHRACELATILMDGGYRPCGRPFVQHLIGTAGVLVHSDFTIDVAIEAVLHAAYTHRRFPPGVIQKALADIHPNAELRVRDNTQRRGQSHPHDPLRASPREAEVMAIAAANEIDMRLSGEYDHSGRPDEIDAAACARLASVLEAIGVKGMAETLRIAHATRRAVPPAMQTNIHASYRYGAGNKRVILASEPL